MHLISHSLQLNLVDEGSTTSNVYFFSVNEILFSVCWSKHFYIYLSEHQAILLVKLMQPLMCHSANLTDLKVIEAFHRWKQVNI